MDTVPKSQHPPCAITSNTLIYKTLTRPIDIMTIVQGGLYVQASPTWPYMAYMALHGSIKMEIQSRAICSSSAGGELN